MSRAEIESQPSTNSDYKESYFLTLILIFLNQTSSP